MRYLIIMNIVVWLGVSYSIGENHGWKENNKNWEEYLEKKIVVDIPKGTLIVERSDGDFLVGRIANQKTKDGLLERLKKGMEIEVLK